MNKKIIKATLAMLPLALSCVPWGILCGTLSMQAGLSNFQAQLMSLIIFAGAAQLSGIALFSTGGSWLGLINTTSMIGARHLLYCATYQQEIRHLNFFKRVLFAFILTDEMFAVSKSQQHNDGYFDYWYAIIAGLVMYIIWNIATAVGIYASLFLKDIDSLGFDFAIIATFIAMVVPMIKNKITLIAVIISAVLALFFALQDIKQGLIISALSGMIIGSFLNRRNVQ